MRNMNEAIIGDLLKVIFSKLPFSNLSICRIVCKAWNHLVLDYISRSKFHHRKSLLFSTAEAVVPTPSPGSNTMHFCNPKIHSMDLGIKIDSVATFKFDGDWGIVSIYCSCNGLLYIAKFAYFDVSDVCDGIWNPMTGEFVQLPVLEEEGWWDTIYGFGFSPKTKQYKLFRVIEERRHTQIEVWRFGISNELNSWNCIERLPFQYFFPGVYLDGVIYWITKVGKGIVAREKKKRVYLLHALDVETETFDTSYPSNIGPCTETDVGIQFMSVEGKLSVIIGPCTMSDFGIELNSFNGKLRLIIKMFQPIWKTYVWIMGAESWSREFVIDIPLHHKPLKLIFLEFSEDGISLLINDDLYVRGKNGKLKIKINTLFHTNEIKDVRIEDVCSMESFQFGSLPKILAGDG